MIKRSTSVLNLVNTSPQSLSCLEFVICFKESEVGHFSVLVGVGFP